MTRRYDIVTFDCYGTLIDWERGISRAFAAAMSADGMSLDPGPLLAAYHEIEPAVQAEGYRCYRDVLAETARRVADRVGWPLARSRAGFLAESLPAWPPFPDTKPALERLAEAGYRLGILSNIDDDLLAGTRRHLTVGFDLIVTAEQVGSYKPMPGHFATARRLIGGGRWLHAAQSYFHDIQPARALGIDNAWINRKAERPADGGPVDREFQELGGLAGWLT
jgi:2-haloalkanoic acid dehalogenase type II